MALRVAASEKKPSALEAVITVSDEVATAPKRLKQGRLPFKALDCKPLTPLNKTPSRKRRLSDHDSSSTNKSKQPKLPDMKTAGENGRPLSLNDDNEVSSTSSSETEHSTAMLSNKSNTGKANLLETFVRREDEITSTIDVVDLTESLDDNGPNENSPVKTKSPRKPVKSPRANPETAMKDKPDCSFSRKLVFDKNDDSGKSERQEALEDTASSCKEQETATENESMEMCASAHDKEEEDKTTEVEDSFQKDTSVIPSIDESTNSSESEISDSQPSTPEKEEGGDSQSDVKTSGLTDTPQTPASGTSSHSSPDGATPHNSEKLPRVLSKKQLEKQALRRKVKEEKEKQKQDAKDQKEKERQEKKRKRDEEKAEKERAKKEGKEKREKERQEKKEQAEKDKQAKMQQKEEEKQKRLEKINAKMEEKKMKEEEKRIKEEQKQKEEEGKLRQEQKRKEAFTNYFLKPIAVTSTKVSKAEDNLFIPFELKKDMTLAPVTRHKLIEEEKECLERILSCELGDSQENGRITYLQELKQNIRRPKRVNRMLRKKKEIEQEVELLVHDSETVKKVTHAAKLLQFHTDYRPPYFGTWRKKVKGLSSRNPWKKDEDVFDYEVDSDEEWEEEEPGESLSDSNGEEEEGEEDDDGDDDGWMVPHGYLSEDEGCQDDEDVTPEMLKARQRAKALAWETELKSKKQVLPPLHLGCFWLDRPCTTEKHLNVFTDFEMICLRSSPIETLISCPTMCDAMGEKSTDTASTSPSSKGLCRKRALPEEAMPDLIRLVHGNYAGIKKLVREFRLFWKQKCTSDASLSMDESHVEEENSKVLNDCVMDSSANLNESTLETAEPAANTTEHEPMEAECSDKTTEEGTGKKQDDSVVSEENSDSVSKRQLEIKIMSIAVREKRPGKKQCWYVNDSTLKQYNMEDLPLENSWVYISGDLAKKAEKKTPRASEKTPTCSAEIKLKKLKKDLNKSVDMLSSTVNATTPHKGKDIGSNTSTPKLSKSRKASSVKKTPKDQPSIMAFAKKALVRSTGDKRKSPANQTDINHSTAHKSAVEDTDVSKQTTTEQPAAFKQSVEHMEEDCIILD